MNSTKFVKYLFSISRPQLFRKLLDKHISFRKANHVYIGEEEELRGGGQQKKQMMITCEC